MDKYLPEWFKEDELDNFIAEGLLARQAWIKGLKRWARTKFMLRKLVGSTPAKFMSRVQRTKHATMANVAIQNAKDIEAARNREETIQAKRNYIRQEEFGMDFEKYLEEKFTKGSQRAFNLGVRSSAGERASEKNPTGNPKVQAKLKKREQRKDMRRRGLKVESFLTVLEEEKKKNMEKTEKPKTEKPVGSSKEPKKEGKGKTDSQKAKSSSKKSNKTIEDRKDTAKVDNIERGDFSTVMVVETPGGHIEIITKSSNVKGNKILLGEQPGSINKRDDLVKFVLDEKFRKTPTATAIFGEDKLNQLLEKRKAQKEEKKETEGAQKKAKEVEKEVEKSVADPMSIIPPSPEDAQRPHGAVTKEDIANILAMPETIDDGPISKQLKELLGKNRVDAIRISLQNNPGYFATSEKLKSVLTEQAMMLNPALAGKDLVILTSDNIRSCMKVSDEYAAMGATDNTPKSDVLVISVEDAKKLLGNVKSKKCAEAVEKIAKNSFKASVKKGKAVAFSAQAAESLAMFENVQRMLRDYYQGQIPMDIRKDLDSLLIEIQKLGQIGNRGVTKLNSDAALQTLTKAMRGDSSTKNLSPADMEFYSNSANIMKSMNSVLGSLLSKKEVKAAIILEQMTGISKFGESSLGIADGIITLDNNGNFTGKIPLFKNITEAMQDEGFMSMVGDVKIMAGRKSKSWIPSSPATPQMNPGMAPTLRAEAMPGGQLNASFDPLEDNKLDIIFEYTFSPPDMTISSMAPETPSGEPDVPTSMMGFSAYQQPQQGDLTAENVLAFLVQAGFIESIYAEPIDFSELGMRINSIQSPIKNSVSVNGRFFEIPVINPGLSESLLDEYMSLNDEIVGLVNNGLSIDEATKIFNEQLNYLLEGKTRNYKREYEIFHSKPEQRKKRSKRVSARRKMAKKLGKKAINGKDIDHKDGNAMNNGDSNLRVRSINKNRADNKHSKKGISETWGAGLEGSWELTLKWLKETPGQLGLVDPKLLKVLMGNKGKAR